MSPVDRVVVDTSLLVGLVDRRDKWHRSALAVCDAFKTAQAEMVYFDCVVNETVSVLARRAREQQCDEEFSDLLAELTSVVPRESITWVSAKTEHLYSAVIELVRDTGGDPNFHDGLIALGSRELGIHLVASFDGDFDRIPWLTRIGDAGDVPKVSGG